MYFKSISLLIEDYQRLSEEIQWFNDRFVTIAYWINPYNWVFIEWRYFKEWIKSGTANEPFLVGTIILIWFMMLGAGWPKKYLFWGWVVFWVLRGVVCI